MSARITECRVSGAKREKDCVETAAEETAAPCTVTAIAAADASNSPAGDAGTKPGDTAVQAKSEATKECCCCEC